MKNIKQLVYAGASSILAFAPFVAGAATATPEGFSVNAAAPVTTGLKNESFYDLISRVLNWLLGLLGILAVIGFVIAGIFYLTAAGDEEQAEKGKRIMLYSIIGLVIALIGLIVVNTLSGLIGGAGNPSAF